MTRNRAGNGIALAQQLRAAKSSLRVSQTKLVGIHPALPQLPTTAVIAFDTTAPNALPAFASSTSA